MMRLFAVLALFVGLAASSPAFAHAQLITTAPPDQAVLAAPPQRVVLTFNEQVSVIEVSLIDSAGQSRALTDLHLEGDAVVGTTPAGLGTGTQVLSYRVISADGHPVGGSVIFSIGAPSATVAAPPPETDPTVDFGIWRAELAVFASLFVGIGGAFFAAFLAPKQILPRPASLIVLFMLPLGLVAAPLSIGLQGLDVLGKSISSFASADAWKAGLATSYGSTVIVAEISLALALAGMLIRKSTPTRILTGIAFLGVGLALSLSGHAATAPPQALTATAVFLHGVGVTFWVGSLMPLAFLLKSREAGAVKALRGFSQFIPFALVPLIAAGVFLALVQVVHFSDLWTTDYGRVLFAKLAAVLVLFGLAGYNRLYLTDRSLAGDKASQKTMVRSIGGELVLVALILGLVATWRFTPPPRNLAADRPASPAFVHAMNDKVMAEVSITPGRSGPVSITVQVTDPRMMPIKAKQVTLAFANPTAGIEPISREAVAGPEGTWTVDAVTIPTRGRWTVDVSVLISDFEEADLETWVDFAN